MNSKNLNKWKELNQILEDNMFEIKHTLDDWKHCYFSDTFDGSVEYDIDDDSCKILGKNNNTKIINEDERFKTHKEIQRVRRKLEHL